MPLFFIALLFVGSNSIPLFPYINFGTNSKRIKSTPFLIYCKTFKGAFMKQKCYPKLHDFLQRRTF